MTDLSPERMAQRLQDLSAHTASTHEALDLYRDFLESMKEGGPEAQQIMVDHYRDGINSITQHLNRLSETRGINVPALNVLRDNATLEETHTLVQKLITRNQDIHSHCEDFIKNSSNIIHGNSGTAITVTEKMAGNGVPANGFFDRFKNHLAKNDSGIQRTNGSTVAGIAIGAGGVALSADGIRRIRDQDQNTALGILETGTGLSLAAEGSLRATTGQGAITWVQRVAKAAQAAHPAHLA